MIRGSISEIFNTCAPHRTAVRVRVRYIRASEQEDTQRHPVLFVTPLRERLSDTSCRGGDEKRTEQGTDKGVIAGFPRVGCWGGGSSLPSFGWQIGVPSVEGEFHSWEACMNKKGYHMVRYIKKVYDRLRKGTFGRTK